MENSNESRNSRTGTPRWKRGFRELEGWIRRQLLQRLVDPSLLPEVLPLEFPVIPDESKRAEIERRFIDRLLAKINEESRTRGRERPANHDRIHCHWCDSSSCEHSMPPDSREVFTGYDQTGRPRWREFSSFIVEEKDARMERLFAKHPAPLALFVPAERLTRDLLQPFRKGAGSARVLAQVAAGFFSMASANGRGERVAVTMQMVERHDRYALHLIAALPPPVTWTSLLAEEESVHLAHLIRWLRRELHRVRGAGQAVRLLERTPGQLEKLLRKGARRTLHAEDRALDPNRPTAAALADALAAKPEDLMFDRKERTILVRGPRNRVHVFREDTTLVTSIHYSADAIRRRVQSRRWEPLSKERASDFRSALADSGSALEIDAAE